jgi:hypothetical protein
MKPLPPWDKVIAVQVRREGGVASVPALARPRMISLRDCPDDQRDRLCNAVVQAAAGASENCGRGDQRYFTVEILLDGDVEPLRFSVPEASAPEVLITLWRDSRA